MQTFLSQVVGFLTESYKRDKSNRSPLQSAFTLATLLLTAATVFASQGAGRMLYTVPNTTFVEQPSGESVVTINDTSGSITAVQVAIDGARSANPDKIIVIHLQRGAVYTVSSAGLMLSSHECLVAEGSLIQAADSTLTSPLITIAPGSTNISVSGGTLEGHGASTHGIFAAAASRVNIDRVVAKNFGLDGIFLNGNGNTAFDNEITITRSEVSGNLGAGIHIQDSTQTTLLDNDCHDNAAGIQISAAWANVANNTCRHNTTGIDVSGGSDNVIANNTCDSNGVGIHAGAANGMIVSNSLGTNIVAGIRSDGTGNTFIDNLFTPGNTANLVSSGTSNNIIAYKAPVSAVDQNYFYPPLIDNLHTDPMIVNGMGRTDLSINSTSIDDVQTQYNTALAANPNNAIVLHLNGTFTVGASPLRLSSNTSVLLNGTIQINSATTATAAITASASGQTRISISGGVIDGGGLTRHNGIAISGASMVQVDQVRLQNFGAANPRVGGSDVIHFDHGATPYVVTRCYINGGAARGIWLQLSGQKSLISDNEVTNVNQDGVDCDSSTFGAVVKFNYCHDLVRYGVFIEQSAKNNLALGNICNNDSRDINVYNNSGTPRGPTQFNSIVANSLLGHNGIRNGAISIPLVVSSHNFFFNNTVINASIQSQQNGTENYYSQNYQSGGTLETSGAETFFNSADVSGNLQIRETDHDLAAVVQNASTADGASVVTAHDHALGSGTNDDEWQFIPTTRGYYRLVNANSGLSLAVQNASTAAGAPIVQATYSNGTGNDEWLIQHTANGTYNFINRLSNLLLDVPEHTGKPGIQLDQAQPGTCANQQFRLIEDAPPPALAPVGASQQNAAANCR
jgi:parallel beta-helix repeat protein